MTGYNPHFLNGFTIEFPKLSSNLSMTVARSDELREGYIADYPNFSIVINADEDKRSAAVVAFQFDQTLFKSTKRRGKWRMDYRFDDFDVLGPEYYYQNPYDRGHLARRSTAGFGQTQTEAQRNANETFYYTNAALQHANLNQDEWLSLEEYARNLQDAQDGKVLSFNGCIYGDTDRSITPDGLPIARVPAGFFKVLAFVNQEGELEVRAFIQYQDREALRDKQASRRVGYDNVVYQTSLMEVEELTGLIFDPKMYSANPLFFSNQPDGNPMNVVDTPERIEITRNEDIISPGQTRKTIRDDDVDVYLIAALVNPDGVDAGNEWVSMINLSGNEIDMTGWTLVDRASKREQLSITKLAPGASHVQHLSVIQLNNNGDTLELYDADGARIDWVIYQEKEVKAGKPVLFMEPTSL
ncbi:DNA/RNA non-specific endonuclease [Enterovibrio coralii]|uniref:Endonuclease n=1 Tax=Enterovibrio coralii TaxID=294935 RepID=A0A135IB19_9GAMM|nr:DNA/RNA non-specific endonuclease [Enterovibrio coralii]KXF82625.1 hypothetical protein ATN88_21425 [Enterovibrio coralii]